MSESCTFIVGKALLWYIYFLNNNVIPQGFAAPIKQELPEQNIARAAAGSNCKHQE
jgi:hypothetical protein